MKIKYSVIFLGITLLSIFSCSDSNEKQKNDLEKENLKGDVLFILESELTEGDDSPTKRYIEYNQFGYTVNDYLEYESPAHLFQFFYDENRLLKCVEQERIGRIDFEKISLYLYDEQNRLLKKQSTGKRSQGESYGNYDVLYSYENDRIKKETTIKNGKEIGYFEFYYSKNLDSTIQKDIMKLTKDESTRFEIVTFNEDGQKIREQSYWVDNGEISLKLVSELSYDDNGNIVKNISKHDFYVGIREWKHEYDSHGNWIKYVLKIDGKKYLTKTRKLYYSNDDISTVQNEVENKISNLFSRNNQNQKKENLEKNNESKSNINYQQPERQKQWVNCSNCNGGGIETCLKCTGNGTTKCDNCYSGTITDVVNGGRKTCYICNGTVRINCKNCNGKGNEGRCSRCNGKGQVQE